MARRMDGYVWELGVLKMESGSDVGLINGSTGCSVMIDGSGVKMGTSGDKGHSACNLETVTRWQKPSVPSRPHTPSNSLRQGDSIHENVSPSHAWLQRLHVAHKPLCRQETTRKSLCGQIARSIMCGLRRQICCHEEAHQCVPEWGFVTYQALWIKWRCQTDDLERDNARWKVGRYCMGCVYPPA
jgi:hypothetical protein